MPSRHSRSNTASKPRHPTRNGLAIPLILLPKQPNQRRLLIPPHPHVIPDHQEQPIAEENGPPADDRLPKRNQKNAQILRIPHIPIQAAAHQSPRRVVRRRRPAPATNELDETP